MFQFAHDNKEINNNVYVYYIYIHNLSENAINFDSQHSAFNAAFYIYILSATFHAR